MHPSAWKGYSPKFATPNFGEYPRPSAHLEQHIPAVPDNCPTSLQTARGKVASGCDLLLVGFPRISRRCCPGRVWLGAPQSITNTPREIATPTTNSPIAR